MPMNEENMELRDLVADTLKAKGVLGKVQAEIRASVFLALEEQEVFKDGSPFSNKPLKEFLKTTNGLNVVSLVREFLEFFNLEFTSMVFDPETHAGIDYTYQDRRKLASELSLTSPSAELPLLAQILNGLKHQSTSSSGVSNGGSQDGSKSIKETEQSATRESANGSSAHNHSGASQERRFQNSGDNSLKNARNENSEKHQTKDSNSLTSLSNIPPLNSKSQSFFASQKRSDTNQADLNVTYDAGDNVRLNGSTNNSDSDGSEIEEEIPSHNSNASGATAMSDDNTVDVSVSRASGHGDYMEGV